MRTRSSNRQAKAQAAVEVDYGIKSGSGSDDGEATGEPTAHHSPRRRAQRQRQRQEEPDASVEKGFRASDDEFVMNSEEQDDDESDRFVMNSEEQNADESDGEEQDADDGDDGEEEDGVLDDAVDAEPKSVRCTRRRSGPAKTPWTRPRSSANTIWARRKQESDRSAIPHYKADTLNKNLRVYVGPLQRHDRYGSLLATMFGPRGEDVDIAEHLRRHWSNFVLPTRGDAHRPGGVMDSPWLSHNFEFDQQRTFRAWFNRYLDHIPARQRSHKLSSSEALRKLPSAGSGGLVTFMGPHSDLQQKIMRQGEGLSLSGTWGDLSENGSKSAEAGGDDQHTASGSPSSAGWIFDVGGTTLDMGWLPRSDPEATQLLALAVVPFSDQAFYPSEKVAPKDDRKLGCVQFWRFESEPGADQIHRPSAKPPKRVGAVFFDWGRPKRMQWCPIPVSHDPELLPEHAPSRDSVCGLLALLCDGKVFVIEVEEFDEDNEEESFTHIDKPIAMLSLTQGFKVAATCLTWVDVNHVACGHTDGSISYWSIHPCMMLQKQSVHRTYVLDIRSGYPSQPQMIASIPVGGCPTIFDLGAPSAEMTSHTMPSANFQSGLLDWNDHIQGYVAAYPNSTPGTTTAGYMHCRYFPQPRTIFQGFSQPVCMAVGVSHPFVLVGCADGSVWAFNAIRKIFYLRLEKLYKLKLFHHEFRPIPGGGEGAGGGGAGEPGEEGGVSGAAERQRTESAIARAATTKNANSSGSGIRGAARILWGFRAEINDNPRNDHARGVMKTAREKKKRLKQMDKGADKSLGSRAGGGDGVVIDGDGVVIDLDRDSEDDYPEDHHPIKSIIVHEPQSRIMKVAWNPNTHVGWWAAAAMGSGLVRVMDLGVEEG